jgi:DNA-binding NtrC family response regulator
MREQQSAGRWSDSGLRPGSLGNRLEESRRVLVVDDDPISRGIVRDMLGEQGFEVDGAENPQTAVEKVRRSRYCLLVLDIFLPGLDGRVLHGSIEKIAPDLAARTIFISHWSPTGAIAEYVAKRGIFIPKPLSAEQLMGAVEALLGTPTGFVPV